MASCTVLKLLASLVLFTFLDASRILTKRACQHETLNITCPIGHGINVRNALFGRTNATICQNPGEVAENCSGGSAVREQIMSKCQYKRTCSIKQDHLKDVCPSVNKYLEVEYICCVTDGLMKSTIACKDQHEPLTINCEGASNSIRIQDSMYGRGHCPSQHKNVNILYHKNNAAFMTEKCDGMKACSIPPSKLFDRSDGNIGYMVVNYQCFTSTT